MDIEKELNDIIIKYDIDKYYPSFRKKKEAEKLLVQLVKDWKNKKIACIATYPTDIIRFKRFLDESYEVDFFVCSKRGYYGKNFDEVFDCHELECNLETYDDIYIISLYGEAFVGHWLRNHNLKYTHIYDYFACGGLVLEKEYNRFCNDRSMEYYGIHDSEEKWQDFVLFELFNQQMKEKGTSNCVLRNLLIKKIFFIAVYIKNFILAEEYIQKLDKNDEDYLEFNLAWKEISKLLQKVELELKARKQRDIILIWEDQLPFHKAKEMPYLTKMMQEGITFDEMFTVTPYSLPTLMTLFCSQDGGNFTYKNKIINEENSKILKILKQHGYNFKEVSGWLQDCFEAECHSDMFHNLYTPSSELLWDVWRNILVQDKKVFIIVMVNHEMHSPWLSTQMDDQLIQDSFSTERAIQGHKDADKQEEFYLDRINENAVKIFMSDHGENDFATRFHVVMTIVNKKYKAHRVKEITSLIDFHEIINQILGEGQLQPNKIEREFSIIQDIDYAYGQKIGEIISHKEPISLHLFGYHGIITKDNIYMKFNNGSEWLMDRNGMPLEPSIFPLACNICDESLLFKYRNLAMQIPKLKSTDREMIYSQYIKRVYNNTYEYNVRKIDKIIKYLNERLTCINSTSVAMRGGGEHTARLISLLSEDNKKKIAYVIDNNDRCLVSYMGYRIIRLDEFSPNDVSLIVLSSHKCLNTFREETKSFEQIYSIQILDLYAWLEEGGIECKHDIFSIEPRNEDYEVDFPYEQVETSVRKRIN